MHRVWLTEQNTLLPIVTINQISLYIKTSLKHCFCESTICMISTQVVSVSASTVPSLSVALPPTRWLDRWQNCSKTLHTRTFYFSRTKWFTKAVIHLTQTRWIIMIVDKRKVSTITKQTLNGSWILDKASAMLFPALFLGRMSRWMYNPAQTGPSSWLWSYIRDKKVKGLSSV